MTDIVPESDVRRGANISNFLRDIHRQRPSKSSEAAGDGAAAAAKTDHTARPTVSVVLPTRNEARNLPYVAKRMPPVDEIIVIDGGSQDGTADVARGLWPNATVIEQTRAGKGNALACGFRAATG